MPLSLFRPVLAACAIALPVSFLTAPAFAQPAPLVASATVDRDAMTVTLPLQFGRMASGEGVWYVLLDTDDAGAAARLGINHAAKLANADVGRAVRVADIGPDGALVFEAGRVDFSPERTVVPGNGGSAFPPSRAEPGSVGDEDYSPLVRVRNGGGHIFNAPVLAFDVTAQTLDAWCESEPDHDLVHDRVARICPREGNVTLSLTEGFSTGKRIVYVSTEADGPVVAALEAATYAPRLDDLNPRLGDGPWSAVEPIYVVVNGATGADTDARQGLESALSDGLGPLNVAGEVPTLGEGYSPLWASHPVFWEADVSPRRLTSEDDILALARDGRLRGFDGPAIAADGLVVNCPAIARID